jgi:hypothetical protein
MTLIKGNHLTARQRNQVLAAFVHRHTAIGDGRHYPTEQAWLADHAFYFVKDGSRLAHNRRYAEPHYVADRIPEPTGGG